MRDELAAKIYTNLSLDDFDSFEDAADYAVDAADALLNRLKTGPAVTTSRDGLSTVEHDSSPQKKKFSLF